MLSKKSRPISDSIQIVDRSQYDINSSPHVSDIQIIPTNKLLAQSRFISEDITTDIRQSIIPLISLKPDEKPLTFKEALQHGFKDKFDELIFSSNLPIAENLYASLQSEEIYDLSLAEFLSIFYYSLEWPPDNSLYAKLNQSLNSKKKRKRHTPMEILFILFIICIKKITEMDRKSRCL